MLESSPNRVEPKLLGSFALLPSDREKRQETMPLISVLYILALLQCKENPMPMLILD